MNPPHQPPPGDHAAPPTPLARAAGDGAGADELPHADAHPHHADVGAAPPVRPASGRVLVRAGVLAVVVLAVIFVSAILPRRAVNRELAADVVARDSAPAVTVTVVGRASSGRELTLPATLQAMHEGAIYARVSGYVTRWHADIGSVVRAGDVLADIDAPELAQEVQQAESQVAQTRATLGLARTELERWRVLAKDSAVSRQEVDQKQAAYDVAAANMGAAEANLRRLTETRRFTRVTAPFTGVITARGVDLGSFITSAGATSGGLAAGAGAGQGPGSLFRIAQTDTVRAYVNVPQAYVASITPGLAADVVVQELAGRTFTGHVARTSRAIDAASRTLLAEVDIRNPNFALLPGMYAQVRLRFARVTPPLLLPAAALLIRADGPQVAVVDAASPGHPATVHFRNVEIARDYGASVEIASGVDEGATVVLNPGTDLVDGGAVRVVGAAPGDRGGASVSVAPEKK
jgi:RND family efflux transporter MFP subunit